MRNLKSKIQAEINKGRPGMPVLIADLRKSVQADPGAFNEAVSEMAKAGDYFLSRCAKPLSSLSQVELEGMIPDGQGKFFDTICKRDQAEQPAPKPGRGGTRPGAGRPLKKTKIKRVPLQGARIPGWLLDWLKAEGDMGHKIEAALIGFYGLKQPE